MIGTSFYKGQGFGNQLWVYAATRCAAIRAKTDFSILNNDKFKGKEFLNLDFGINISTKRLEPSLEVPDGFTSVYREKQLINQQFNCDVTEFDSKIWLPEDGTFLEGSMQSENYIIDYKSMILTWLSVPSIEFDGCVINLRGGEYKSSSELFLQKSYYENAILKIKEIDKKCKFLIVTDDRKLAARLFSDMPIISSGGVKIIFRKFYVSPKSHLIGRDFALIQNAKYLILSNSSFSWWGAWTNSKAKLVIAPKYWARHNISNGFWSSGDSLTRDWLWLNRHGDFSTYAECKAELKEFKRKSI